MPELPEVETMKRGLTPILGCTIESVTFPKCRLRPIGVEPSRSTLRRRVTGQVVSRLGRIGKRVVVELENRHSLIFEPRMTGIVLVADPPNWTHLRLAFSLSGGDVDTLMYWDRRGLGSVKCLSPAEISERYGPDRLGPDALDCTGESFRSRLGQSRREIKVALLDQRAVAGIGNLYAAEILHRCGIHPQQRCDELSKRQWESIAENTRFVLEEAIRYEGSTLSDGTYRNALNESGSYQNAHRVYDREGQPCPSCGRKTIARIVQAQRSTFFCAQCQKLKKKARANSARKKPRSH